MNQDLKTFCTLFYQAANIPVTCFTRKGQVSFGCPGHFLFLPPMAIEKMTQNPFICTSSSGGFYGLIRIKDTDDCLCVGPCYNVAPDDKVLHDFLKEQTHPRERREDILAILSAIPTTGYTGFLNQIAFLHFCLNREHIDIGTYAHLDDTSRSSMQQRKSLRQYSENKEQQVTHNTYALEREIYDLIASGDVEKLKTFFANPQNFHHLNEGVMADNPLSQCKNIFIGAVTKLGVLGAIPGGLDPEQTYQMIDHYAQECERMTLPTDIYLLLYDAAIDFCQRVSRNRIPAEFSPELYECISFIRNHTNETICVNDVAAHIGKSRSYVAKKFKDDLGINVGAFISRCKLEEAKSLLAYTAKPLSEISSLLCFSSQSYFQNVFKKQYGVTPLQYRKQHHI